MNKLSSGLLLIDKSPGFTSHHVVAAIRKTLKNSLDKDVKVGHLGTLDPFASGLLPILIGGVTRLTDEMMDGKKQYLFQIKLGVETDTLDTAGQVIKTAPVPNNYMKRINHNLKHFIGEIDQVPPVYSALKMQGRPLYEYMRAEGKLPIDIETKKRKIFIENLSVVNSNFDLAEPNSNECIVTLRVLCGKGTYVRSLARDIAASIETVGHCFSLRREYVEPWHVDNALLFSQDKKPTFEDIEKNIILPEQILSNIPKIIIPENQTKLFCSGNIVTLIAEQTTPKNWKYITNSNVCFAETVDKDVMYYCALECTSENSVKIKPNKKIN